MLNIQVYLISIRLKLNRTISNCNFTASIVPVGLYLNDEVAHATYGDEIITASHTLISKRLKYKRKLKIGTGEFILWAKLVFGDDFSWEYLKRVWRNQCIVMGLGVDGFSQHECWLLIFDD